MRYLSREDVEGLLDMRTCIDTMRGAFLAVAVGKVQAPARTVIRVEEQGGFFGAMPVYAAGYGSAAKVMTIYPGNHDAGIASHQGYILLFAEEHGEPIALVEAGSITELRTAAVSGLATEILANSDAETLCILGSGVQARSHVKAMCCVRDIRSIQVWSRTREHAEKFGSWARSETAIETAVRGTAEGALEGADVVCTVTAAKDPVVSSAWLTSGCHVNAVGSFTPTARELDSETIQSASLFVDSKASALAESGDVLIPVAEGVIDSEHIQAELAALVTSESGGRQSPAELTVFKSLGLAVEDLAASRAVFDRAVVAGVGTLIP
jgi:ornithine cyclodeaminase